MKQILSKARASFVLKSAAIAALGMTASGCVYDAGLGLGYASDGYASGCDSYSDFDSYYDCDYGDGFSNIGYGGGWYSDYYYPGYGYFVFDRYGRRYSMHRDHLRYWGGQRYNWYRGHGRGGHHGGGNGNYGGGHHNGGGNGGGNGNYGGGHQNGGGGDGNYGGGHHNNGNGGNGGGHHNNGNGGNGGGHQNGGNGGGGNGGGNANPGGVLDGGFGSIRNRPGKPVFAPAPGKRPPDSPRFTAPPPVEAGGRRGSGMSNGGFGRPSENRNPPPAVRQAPPVARAPASAPAPRATPTPREQPRQQARFEKFRGKED
jgi:hypothetical protein